MLWQIENTPHKLLGSIHLLPQGQALPVWMPSDLSGIGRIVFEADHTKTTEFLEIGVDREAPHLSHPGVQGLYDRAAELLKSVGNENPFDALLPWRANMHMTFALLAASDGVSGESGVESILRTQAQKDSLLVDYLETPSRAFDLFTLANSGPTTTTEGFAGMQRLVADPSLARRNYQRILAAWLDSDLADMTNFLTEQLRFDPVTLSAVITQRNREWLPVAAEMIRSDTPTLFVVGSLHTVGHDSFINQLQSIGLQCRHIIANG